MFEFADHQKVIQTEQHTKSKETHYISKFYKWKIGELFGQTVSSSLIIIVKCDIYVCFTLFCVCVSRVCVFSSLLYRLLKLLFVLMTNKQIFSQMPGKYMTIKRFFFAKSKKKHCLKPNNLFEQTDSNVWKKNIKN